MKEFAILLSLFILTSLTPIGTFYFTNTGVVSFRSEAPQELIKATSKDLRGLIDTEKKTFVFKVIIRTFEGFNSALQREHFNEKYLESEKYPEALFIGKIIEDIDFEQEGTYSVRAKGKFSIHGIEQERIIKTTISIHKGGFHIDTQFVILIADYNIKIPKVVHEKIASEITIEVNADLKRKVLLN